MRTQLKKVGVLLSLASVFALMAASEPYGVWFNASESMETYCSGHVVHFG